MVLHVDLSAERGPATAPADSDNNAPWTSGGERGALTINRKYLGIDRSRPIAAGDVVVVYERHDRTRALVVTPGDKFNNQFGAFHHDVREREDGEKRGGGEREGEREREKEAISSASNTSSLRSAARKAQTRLDHRVQKG